MSPQAHRAPTLRTPPARDAEHPVALVLDGEALSVLASAGELTVRYGAPSAATVHATSTYEAVMDAATGTIGLQEFWGSHLTVEGQPVAVEAFARLMKRTLLESFMATVEP